MKTTNRIKLVGIFLTITCAISSFSQTEKFEDKTLSPYFFIQNEKSSIDQMPLKSTIAFVNISGVIADVKVQQVYKNEGLSVLEAIYVFPASTRAAVYGMKMIIGERTIEAKIEDKEKAREQYEEAKNNGQSASLLEQQRPNVFQMNVANILPGDEILVELSYTEMLIPDDGIYEFVYPTVVGPRYSNTPEDIASTSENWISNPYTKEGEVPYYEFDINVNLLAGIPVNDVICNTHDVKIDFLGSNQASVKLNGENKLQGNRDFILKYKLQGNQIESGLLLYEGEKENFFLAMIQPPENIKPEIIPPREYVFIVDVSGSMSGFPLDVSKELLKELIGNLKSTDKFNVLLFAGSSNLFSSQSVEANTSNIQKAIKFLDRERGGGGTELMSALRKALNLKGTENFARTFVIVTDGYVSVEKEAYDLIRENLGNANFFTFGIGSSVNRYIIEGMAHVGKGSPFIATNLTEAKSQAKKFRKYISNPVMTNIDIAFSNFDVYNVEPLDIPDVFSNRPVILFGKYKNKPIGSINLTGTSGDKILKMNLKIENFKPSKKNSALKYLWAREKIRLLDDYTNLAYNEDHADEITSLGMKYNLLTAYTSFIAIDSEIRNENGEIISVKQPLPLPEGVSNLAIGSNYMGSRGIGKPCKGSSTGLDEISLECVGMVVNEDEAIQYTTAKKSPEYNGGSKALKNFIKQHLKYPEEAQSKNIEGTVFIEITVTSEGTIEKLTIKRGVHEMLEQEALRVIMLTSGKWIPANQNGIPTKSVIVIPVKFKI